MAQTKQPPANPERFTLLEWFGPTVTLPDVLVALSSNCLRRGGGRFSDPWKARYRTLPPSPQ